MEIAKSSRKSLHLPEEIIEEIQSRFPVKSLLRLRCVSKSWQSLIGSKRFSKTHHQNSIKNTSFPHQRVIIQKDLFGSPVQCSLLSFLSELTNTILSCPLADPTNTTSMRFRIIGSCNGLLCIREKQGRIHLLNPSTRIAMILPEISNPCVIRGLGFGWVESSDEYKVFAVVADYDYYHGIGKIYSSKTKSWKTIEHCAELVSCGVPGIFGDGKLYWKNNIKEDIIFLDLKSEVFGRIQLPFDQEMYSIVGVLGGFLCVLCYIGFSGDVFRVWVMKEEAWKRAATFANLVELLQPATLVVGLIKGEILVNCESMLLVYDRQDNVFRCPKMITRDWVRFTAQRRIHERRWSTRASTGIALLGKFACGRLHWDAVSGGHTYIESFDLKSEVFETMELPCKLPEVDGICPWLWVIEGCLISVVCNDNDNGKRRVWIMKEYGVKESWVEEISKPSKKIRRCSEAFFYPESLVSPIPQKNLE